MTLTNNPDCPLALSVTAGSACDCCGEDAEWIVEGHGYCPSGWPSNGHMVPFRKAVCNATMTYLVTAAAELGLPRPRVYAVTPEYYEVRYFPLQNVEDWRPSPWWS